MTISSQINKQLKQKILKLTQLFQDQQQLQDTMVKNKC